jgi:hypothetical protein
MTDTGLIAVAMRTDHRTRRHRREAAKAKSQHPDAEDAEVSQRTQKKT